MFFADLRSKTNFNSSAEFGFLSAEVAQPGRALG